MICAATANGGKPYGVYDICSSDMAVWEARPNMRRRRSSPESEQMSFAAR